jgi:hypothetical protein
LSRRREAARVKLVRILAPSPMGSSACVGWTGGKRDIPDQTATQTPLREHNTTSMHPDRPSHTRSLTAGVRRGRAGWWSLLDSSSSSSVKPGHVPSTAVPAPEPRRHAVIRLDPCVSGRRKSRGCWGAADGDKLAGGGSQGLVPVRRGWVSSMASTSVSRHIDWSEAAAPAVVL